MENEIKKFVDYLIEDVVNLEEDLIPALGSHCFRWFVELKKNKLTQGHIDKVVSDHIHELIKEKTNGKP